MCASVRRPWVRRVVGRARLCDRCGRWRQRVGHNIYIIYQYSHTIYIYISIYYIHTLYIYICIRNTENDATGNVFLIGKLCRELEFMKMAV